MGRRNRIDFEDGLGVGKDGKRKDQVVGKRERVLEETTKIEGLLGDKIQT